jgi:hypothetical protein
MPPPRGRKEKAMERAIERNRFRKIIQDYLDGNYPGARKIAKCSIDDYFTKALGEL